MKLHSITDVANILRSKDNIIILVHRFPDGDTLGCGFALCKALQSMGKHARVRGSDAIPDKFKFLAEMIEDQEFEPEFIVAVDVATESLLGSIEDEYKGKIDLCIDHHASNSDYAKQTYVEPDSAAAAEVIYLLIKEMSQQITPQIADCLFTGISTDTGCFKFTNVTARTHRIASELIEYGCRSSEICKIMFDTKSRVRLEVEKKVLEGLDYRLDGKCAFITLSCELTDGVDEGEIDGISTLPRQIEGVSAGVTLRELKTGGYKISFRTGDGVNASSLASHFGGGGHAAAAGCTIIDTEDNVKAAITKEVEKAMKGCGLL